MSAVGARDAIESLATIRDWLRFAVTQFHEADLSFGHGLPEAFDEAAYLLLHALHLPRERLEAFLDARLTMAERKAIHGLIRRRCTERIPAAYITHEAWLGDHRFYVDRRVIVPRSFIAELLDERMSPWVPEPGDVHSILDLCTGSGCLAILAAIAFPDAHIDAADISPDALEVARRNVDDYALHDRIELLRSDLFDAIAGRRYDIILCNPPYVTTAAMRALPPEFRHEPALALAAGADGMDSVRRILSSAREHLSEAGMIFVEVGHNRDLTEAAFPELPFTWVATRSSDDSVFLLRNDELPPTREARPGGT